MNHFLMSTNSNSTSCLCPTVPPHQHTSLLLLFEQKNIKMDATQQRNHSHGPSRDSGIQAKTSLEEESEKFSNALSNQEHGRKDASSRLAGRHCADQRHPTVRASVLWQILPTKPPPNKSFERIIRQADHQIIRRAHHRPIQQFFLFAGNLSSRKIKLPREPPPNRH